VIEAAGPRAIARHVDALAERLIGALAEQSTWRTEAARLAALRQAGRTSSIISLHHHGRGEAFLRELSAAGAKEQLYASVREGYLRIALHGYHTAEDVERIAAWLSRAGAA